jgi:hypothetical protein
MKDFYVKSRRTYLLVAAILFAWEFFELRITAIPGIDANLTEGQVELVPRFLALIYLYMAYRVTVDWLYFSPSKAASRLDFVVIHCIGFGALVAYLCSALYPAEDIQFFGLYIGLTSAMYLCLMPCSLSSKLLSHIPQIGVMKFLRNKWVSLAFWGFMLLMNLIVAYLIYFLDLYTLNIVSVAAGFIGFIPILTLFWVAVRIPLFVANSDEGNIVSRINQAFDAEEELTRIESERDDSKHA